MIKVLVVDDSALMRRLLGNIFEAEEGFQVAFARDGVEGLAMVHEFRPDVVTLDVHMPNMDGLTCLDRIMLERPTRVIMVSSLTGNGADKTFEAMNLGAVDFVTKPEGAISLAIGELRDVLLEKVRSAVKTRLRASHRLTERVRLRAAALAAKQPAPPVPSIERPQPKPAKPFKTAGPQTECVVVVGASTGGPPALDVLLSALPANFPWPVLIAQHMPATFTGPLARRLDRLCALHVQEVASALPLEPGNVYIGRGDADIVMMARGESLYVTSAPPLPEHRWHPSVDRLVETTVHLIGAERTIGVLMTGMGDDGAAAMAQLRAEGGRTIAESEETAVVWGMPGELVKRGGAAVVTPLDKIAAHLKEWAA
ncbi:chemotaxis-specific protein-glutamate methyltransferase CheB [Hyphomicrobium sp.]|uniref:chemotaxis-specific protein-glutamate methyltransferase CheB n=1 Tax=Hyphomicrobium sp. TaxID=82 RepID=UPI002D764A26|nr:chemotaxis-specific protein-glutamate methyltransferase CheB [Hyphomicrobium sp.]HET6388544.1 chemotaxis-specific protein-glutamate methyltransferase CheB [Hyphomicrobium sp.]